MLANSPFCNFELLNLMLDIFTEDEKASILYIKPVRICGNFLHAQHISIAFFITKEIL
jgi:hypothetical protein